MGTYLTILNTVRNCHLPQTNQGSVQACHSLRLPPVPPVWQPLQGPQLVLCLPQAPPSVQDTCYQIQAEPEAEQGDFPSEESFNFNYIALQQLDDRLHNSEGCIICELLPAYLANPMNIRPQR